MIYLEKALELEKGVEDAAFKADTHLNISAVLSQMGRYDLAMYHAQNAIITIQSNLLFTFLPETKQNYSKKDGKELKDEMKKEFKDKISILAVAYHNLAVQQEYLKLYAEALENYE
jgi:tetratricopeptide (TPR) repeat protein